MNCAVEWFPIVIMEKLLAGDCWPWLAQAVPQQIPLIVRGSGHVADQKGGNLMLVPNYHKLLFLFRIVESLISGPSVCLALARPTLTRVCGVRHLISHAGRVYREGPKRPGMP
jgi:hypothetical protein